MTWVAGILIVALVFFVLWTLYQNMDFTPELNQDPNTNQNQYTDAFGNKSLSGFYAWVSGGLKGLTTNLGNGGGVAAAIGRWWWLLLILLSYLIYKALK